MWKHPIFKGDAQRVGVWTWMLHTAAWKDTSVPVEDFRIPVKRGQLCVSQRQIQDATGMGRQAVRNFLSLLEESGAITQETTQGPNQRPTQRRTIVTICKYEEYQARDDKGNPSTNPTPQPLPQPINEQDIKTILPSEGNAALPPNSVIEVSVLSKAVWDAGKPFLASRGVPNGGAMIGRWLKSSGPADVLYAIDLAQKSGTQDPIPYITQILNGGQHGTSPANDQSARTDPALEQIARLTGIAGTSRNVGG